MTDDAMRKAFEKWYLGEHPTNIDVKSIARTADYELMITRINWIAWQAATTALLEKLKSEGMVEKCARAIFRPRYPRIPNPTWADICGAFCDRDAKAVIEALEKELVG